MRRLAAFALITALTACGEQPMGASEPATAPADAPASAQPGADFGGDFDMVGTEPFWDAKIRADKLTLTRPDHADLTVANPGSRLDGVAAVWDAGATRLVLTLTLDQCSDGMSDRVYPFTARAQLNGETLRGCAARPGDLAAGPKP